MMPSQPVTHFVLRQAEPGEIERLLHFYQANASQASPAPSLTTLGKALNNGRLLVIEHDQDLEIEAVTATFDFLPDGYGAYVGELSGRASEPASTVVAPSACNVCCSASG